MLTRGNSAVSHAAIERVLGFELENRGISLIMSK